MRMEVTILKVKHYSMDGNEGASVLLYDENYQRTNNSFGIDVTESPIPYEEISKLADVDLPAKIKADVQFKATKSRTGKEVTGIALSNLEFVSPVTMTNRKA